MSKKIFVLGANGMLGQAIMSELALRGLSYASLSRNEVDLCSFKSLTDLISPGEMLINCAAYTDVAGAESNSELAFKINAYGPSKVAQACSFRDVKYVHVSTDYVFDGLKSTPYVVTDKTNPIQQYGMSKALGEQMCQEHEATIIRTSWLYGAGRNNFYSKILNKLARKEIVEVVDDQIGVPTSTEFFATQLLNNISAFENERVVHLVPHGSTSWFGFAKKIAELLGPERSRQLRAVKTPPESAPKRPKFSMLHPHEALDNRSWQQVLHDYWEKNRVHIPS